MSIGDDETLLVIISRALKPKQEGKLVRVLGEHRGAFGWTLADLKEFSPTIYTHTILESEARPRRDPYGDLTYP